MVCGADYLRHVFAVFAVFPPLANGSCRPVLYLISVRVVFAASGYRFAFNSALGMCHDDRLVATSPL